VPDAIRFQDVAGFVDEDIEGKTGLFDIATHRLGCLCDDGYDLRTAACVFR
jgi:hypothetical protein